MIGFFCPNCLGSSVSKTIHSHHKVRQPCLYFKDSKGVFKYFFRGYQHSTTQIAIKHKWRFGLSSRMWSYTSLSVCLSICLLVHLSLTTRLSNHRSIYMPNKHRILPNMFRNYISMSQIILYGTPCPYLWFEAWATDPLTLHIRYITHTLKDKQSYHGGISRTLRIYGFARVFETVSCCLTGVSTDLLSINELIKVIT